MNNLMIDLETMGTTPSAPILSIGAVFFDPLTGELGNEFFCNIDWKSAFQGRKVTPDTVKWWMTQSVEARGSLLSDKFIVNMSDALQELQTFIFKRCSGVDAFGYGGVKVWGNGATFDISILENAFRQYKKRIPWHFTSVRDCRTVEDIAEPAGYIRNDIQREGIHHNALHDAKYEAKYISYMVSGLLRRNKE